MIANPFSLPAQLPAEPTANPPPSGSTVTLAMPTFPQSCMPVKCGHATWSWTMWTLARASRARSGGDDSPFQAWGGVSPSRRSGFSL